MSAQDYFAGQPAPEHIRERIATYGSWIEVDLDAVSFNLANIRARTGAQMMPVIKNNAYGHGLLPMSAHLEREGVEWLMVAKRTEAERLRAAGIECEILMMDMLLGDEQCDRVVAKGITPAIFTLESAERLSAAAARVGRDAQVMVKVDTGLRRVGVRDDLAADLIERIVALPGIRLAGVFSSFMQHPEQDPLMLDRYLAVCAELERRSIEVPLKSMASTNAIFHDPRAWLDIVRPAMCLFGVYPFEGDAESGLELKQVLTLHARLEYVKDIAKGDSVTYFGSFTAPHDMQIGTLHVGFYDGLPRELANKGSVLLRERHCRRIGTVALNHSLVDLTGVEARFGDAVTVIGTSGENSMKATADEAGWMPYSLMNHLNPATPRVYLQGGEPVALLDPELDG